MLTKQMMTEEDMGEKAIELEALPPRLLRSTSKKWCLGDFFESP